MEMTLTTSSGSIHVSWDDDRLNDSLFNLFTPWQMENGSTPLYNLSVERNEFGYTLHTPDGIHNCGDERELFISLEYGLTLLFQRIYERNLLIHASCIERDGKGALLIGEHGSGKTTLALTAISSGMHALTDDVAILSPDLHEVIGFPRPFKVEHHTRDMIPSLIFLKSPAIPCSEDLTYFCFYTPEGRYYVEKTQLKYIFFPRRHNGPTELRPLGETEAMRLILHQGFNFYLRKETLVGELLDLFRIAPPYEMLYSDHWNAIWKVNSVL
jgi:hypothetical protein